MIKLPHSDQIHLTRRDRLAATKLVRQAIAAKSAYIKVHLPDSQPHRRMTYQAVNAAAYHKLGSCTYRLQDCGGYVLLSWGV